MKRTYFETLRTIETGSVANDLSAVIKNSGANESVQSRAIALATILYEMQAQKSNSDINSIINGLELSDDAKETLVSCTLNLEQAISNLKNQFTEDQLTAFILFDNTLDNFRKNPQETTPEGISRLAIKILDIQPDDTVLDLCSGKGSFAVEQFGAGDCKSYTGIEIDFNAKFISEIRGHYLGKQYSFLLKNAFDSGNAQQYDKLFSNYPFSLHLPSLNDQKEAIRKELGIKKSAIQRASSDWLFNSVLVSQLNETGKAVAIMTNGSALNHHDNEIRKHFVEKGLIEAVISLPGKLFDSTAIPTTLIVFSKNNKQIRLIDASEICSSIRKKNILDEDSITEIIELMSRDSSISATESLAFFAEDEYSLNPVRYFEKTPEIKNGIKFEEVVKSITRGAQLKAADIDLLKSDSKTDYQYLMISNINDGLLNLENQQYLKEIPANLDKYCVSNNSIILSKTGTPAFKSAVAAVKEGALLANGNMFIIELDENKVNPYYIQAFLASDVGNTILKSISSGSVINTISLSKLKEMIIPLPALSEQDKIADRYIAAIEEIAVMKEKINKLTDQTAHIFDSEL